MSAIGQAHKRYHCVAFMCFSNNGKVERKDNHMAETIYHVIVLSAAIGSFIWLFAVAILWILEDWQ